MTKKEQRRFDKDVNFLLNHTIILNIDLGGHKHTLQDCINTVENTLFMREIKDAVIERLKGMDSFKPA